MKWLVTDDRDQTVFLHVCRQAGKLDVLKLMADVLSSAMYRCKDFNAKKLVIENRFYWRNVVAKASSYSTLRDVIEILYHMKCSKIILEFPNLVTKLKPHWEEVDVMHGTVKLLLKLTKSCSKVDNEILIRSGSLVTLSVLFGLLLSKNPPALSIYFGIGFPRDLDDDMYRHGENIITKLVKAVYDVVMGSQQQQQVVKIIRSVIPLMSHTLGEILDAGVNTVEMYVPCGFFTKLIISLTFVTERGTEHDLKLMLSSKIMERLVFFLDEFTSYTPTFPPEVSGKPQVDYIVTVVMKSFLEMRHKVDIKSRLTKKERISLLQLMESFLKSEAFFELGMVGIKHIEVCITTIDAVVEKDSGSNELQHVFLRTENTMMSTLIAVGERLPPFIHLTSTVMFKIFWAFEENPRLLKQLMPFPSSCMNHLVDKGRIDQTGCGMKRGGSLDWNVVLAKAIKICYLLMRDGSLLEIQCMDEKFKIIDSLLNVLKQTNDEQIIKNIMSGILTSLIRKWDFSLLTTEKLIKVMPVVWRKMKKSDLLKKFGMEFTYSVVRRLPKSHTFDFSDLEPLLCEMTASYPSVPLKSPALLTLMWDMAKQSCKHGQLFIELCRLSSDKTVEFAAPEKTEQAKIFKFISDMLIEFIEKDPADEVEFLRDLTQCLVIIARCSSLDEETYVLEDMVSPAMWFLEKQNDEQIVANVKEFISILH